MVAMPVRYAQRILNTNPIARAELNHVDRFMRGHPRRRWAVIVIVMLASFASAIGAGLTLIDNGLGIVVNELRGFYPVILLAAAVFFLHYMMLYRLVNLAGESVVREKRSNNWDTLLMTGISAQRFVTGKWIALVRAVWVEVLVLALLRAVLCVGLGYTLFSSGTVNLAGMPAERIEFPALQSALAALMIILFTATNAVFTVSAGVAASFITRIDSAPGQTAMTVRIVSMMVPVLLTVCGALFYLYVILDSDPSDTIDLFTRQIVVVISWSQLSLIDNGSVVTGLLASPHSHNGGILLLSLLIALALYAVLTVFLLRVAAWLAVKQGMIAE